MMTDIEIRLGNVILARRMASGDVRAVLPDCLRDAANRAESLSVNDREHIESHMSSGRVDFICVIRAIP